MKILTVLSMFFIALVSSASLASEQEPEMICAHGWRGDNNKMIVKPMDLIEVSSNG